MRLRLKSLIFLFLGICMIVGFSLSFGAELAGLMAANFPSLQAWPFQLGFEMLGSLALGAFLVWGYQAEIRALLERVLKKN